MEGSAIAVIGMAGRLPHAGSLTSSWSDPPASVQTAQVDVVDTFLQRAREALEGAGYVGEAVAGPVGVFASCSLSESRVVSEVLNHGGREQREVMVRTACPSTVPAIQLACRSLLDGECNLAFAGGAVACVLLKRLSDAERDGDNLVAIVRTATAEGDVVLEEPPPRPDAGPSRSHHLLVVSARTEASLGAATRTLALHLSDHRDVSLADVAFTLIAGRKAYRHRRAVVARDVEDAVRGLAAQGPDAAWEGTAASPPRGVVFLFPDTDAVYSGMGKELYRSERLFRGAVDACRAVLRSRLPHVKGDPRDVIMDELPGAGQAGPGAASPSLALLSLFAVEYAMSKLLSSWGVAPVALLGRGTGEIAAACVAGVMSLEEAIAIVAEHGAWLDTSASPQRRTTTSSEDLAALCRTIRFETPRTPLIASNSGTWITDAQATDPRYWVDQICRSARLENAMRTVVGDKDRILVEVGPGRTMSRLASQLPRCAALPTLSPTDGDASEVAALLEAMAAMWTAGDVELGALYDGQARRRVSLPAHPWQRSDHRREAAANADGGTAPPHDEVHCGPVAELRSLVTIQRGDGRRPFFCVHGAEGTLANVRDLARALPADSPFFGLQARGVDGVLRPHETIEGMADSYLEEIRRCQPSGPYVLGGYSAGGLVAFEIARRLTESKDAVELLVLIDTLPPDAPVRALAVARRLERMMHEGLGHVRGAIESKLATRREQLKLDRALCLAHAGEPIPADLREAYLRGCFDKAVARHRLEPWSGRANLLRAEHARYTFADVDPGYGWEHVISDLEITIVPGSHEDLFLVPHKPMLVSALGRAIEQTSIQPGQRSSPSPRLERSTTELAPMLRLAGAPPAVGGLGGERDPFAEGGHGTAPGAGDDVPPASV